MACSSFDVCRESNSFSVSNTTEQATENMCDLLICGPYDEAPGGLGVYATVAESGGSAKVIDSNCSTRPVSKDISWMVCRYNFRMRKCSRSLRGRSISIEHGATPFLDAPLSGESPHR